MTTFNHFKANFFSQYAIERYVLEYNMFVTNSCSLLKKKFTFSKIWLLMKVWFDIVVLPSKQMLGPGSRSTGSKIGCFTILKILLNIVKHSIVD